ncbi:MAG: ABC transporter permease [Oscillospiraceae bacterium]|nr:ABC transporter permease [Oscillospiraceae bacterium]
MKKYMPLLGNLISRDLKVKYRRSVLGFLWSILNPLLMALVMNMVFSRLFRFQVEYFATYYLIGSLIFNFVVECTSGSLMSVIYAAPLIKKVYIPKYIFPMEKCAFAFINMLFGTFAVVVVMVIQGVPFTANIFLFIIPMLYALVFAFGLGLVLAALTVFFRDVEHLYSVWVTIWMYLTPIIYPEELVASTSIATVMKCNPMYYYVHMLRSVVMYGTLPSLNEHIICIAFSLMMLVLGLGLFKKVQDKFILYI